MLDVALLGTGGMMPLPNRFLTSMICRLNGRFLMVDCGESTQVTLKMLGWGFKNIDVICFTHFHADHISGLPGLLLTMGNSGREEPLRLIGPPGLQTVVESLCVIAPELPFSFEILEMPYGRDIVPPNMQIGQFLVHAQPVDHRIPCFAYGVELKRAGRFDLERAKAHQVPMALWSRLQKNETIETNGRIFTPEMVLGPPRKSIRVTYCTDSRPLPALTEFASESDLFICEGLYGEPEKQSKAAEHRHMTFQEAARIARDANVKELWLTHFSPALTAPESCAHVAKEIFPRTVVGKDRMCKTLLFDEE